MVKLLRQQTRNSFSLSSLPSQVSFVLCTSYRVLSLCIPNLASSPFTLQYRKKAKDFRSFPTSGQRSEDEQVDPRTYQSGASCFAMVDGTISIGERETEASSLRKSFDSRRARKLTELCPTSSTLVRVRLSPFSTSTTTEPSRRTLDLRVKHLADSSR